MMEDTLSVSSNASAGDNNSNVNNNYDISMNQQPPALIGGHNKYEWMYLLLCVPNAILLIVCSAMSIKNSEDHVLNAEPIFRLQILACILAGISIIFVLYGLFGEHQYDLCLYTMMIVHGLFFSWTAVSVARNQFFLVLAIWLGVGSLLLVISIPLGWKATHVPDWVEFWIIGVSEALTDMYKELCYFLALLRLDSLLVVIFAFYSISFTFPILSQESELNWWLGYQVAMMIFAYFSFVCGKLSVTREDLCLVKCFQGVNAVYACYLSVQMGFMFGHIADETSSENIALYCVSIILDIICLIVRIHCMFHLARTSKTFGHGLNTPSFNELVSRNSNSLLSHPRSDPRF